MGGDLNPEHVNYLSSTVKTFGLKYAWYSGRACISDKIDIFRFDYIKVGPYIDKLGSLRSKNTNQKMYRVLNGNLIDITFRFQQI
jgi:anaerobic ribonucleoside-triphosphate reductase activating protein